MCTWQCGYELFMIKWQRHRKLRAKDSKRRCLPSDAPHFRNTKARFGLQSADHAFGLAAELVDVRMRRASGRMPCPCASALADRHPIEQRSRDLILLLLRPFGGRPGILCFVAQ